MAFWKFTGASTYNFNQLSLVAHPNYVYDFGATTPPSYPAVKEGAQPLPSFPWVTDPGPVTDGPVSQQSDLSGDYVALGATPVPKPPEPQLSLVKGTQAGNTITLVGAPATSNLNDTSDFALGSQSCSITSTAASQVVGYDSGTVALDMTNKGFVFWARIDNGATNMQKAEFHVICNAGADAWVAKILNGVANAEDQQYAKSGEWIKYYVPFASISQSPLGNGAIGAPSRSNVVKIRFRHTNIDTLPLSTKLNGFATYPEPVNTFPNGVVSLTYDDTYLTQFNLSRPDLDKYGFKATLYPIIERVGTANCMTLAQLQQLHDRNGWEIGTHCYYYNSHANGWTGMTQQQRQAELKLMQDWQVSNGFNDSDSHAYPRGRFDLATIADIKRFGYRSARGVYQMPEVVGTPYPYRLRIIDASGWPIATLKAYVDVAKASRCWVIFMIHETVASAPDASLSQMLTADHTTLVDYIASQGVPVKTVSEVMRSGAPV
jgi:peptidoglycan/xylan/chitin deacetylase (PgdA/CDA1 family)